MTAVAGAARPGDVGDADLSAGVRSILSNNCFQCHGPDEAERQADLRLDDLGAALRELPSGVRAIIPGEPDESELIRRIRSSDDDVRMPPPEMGKQLSEREIDLLAEWIRHGAEGSQHWSYRPLGRPAVPAVDPEGPNSDEFHAEWPSNEIDNFVLRRLQQAGMGPAPELERAALARRLSLDLTGLPPTWEEVNQFVHDAEPGAVNRWVEYLLAQPSYGEHWARMWLDLARYADSAGYADDPPRTIWAYRDWVIRALNDNMPFDQFTIEQLAGDLLPEPTEEQLIATAFHRNTLTNNEGGTSDEEFRNVAIVDRVNTTMAVWMGTTMACAQCHNHKFDPISQEEYFQLFAIFNNTEDHDQRDERPLLELWNDQKKDQQQSLQNEIAQLERDSEPESKEYEAQLARAKKELDALTPETTVPIARELRGEQRRKTHIQLRGNFLNLGKEVAPALPTMIQSSTAFRLPSDESPPDRLALARWLVDANNPLTARVIANRYWEALFGVGLVRTSEEFGAQGEAPSHPELLDWLASELVRLDWDIKAFLRLLVTSSTYRQSAAVTAEQFEDDPDNRLLARGPRFRLSAEMIRDQALAVSGLLSRKMYGPPVRPPQPALGLSAAFGGGVDWTASDGEDRYRRGIYTTWRRSSPYPSMSTFDAPNREVCTVRRERTNTPLQALVTLNDPVYVEAAQALARRLAAAASTTADGVQAGYRRCLSRDPSEQELDHVVLLFNQAQRRLANRPEAARQLATDPLGPLPADADPVVTAAWTVVANVLLNLDEMMLKR